LAQLKQSYYPTISLALLSRSSKSLYDLNFQKEISLDNWSSELQGSSQPALSPKEVLNVLISGPRDAQYVVVDNTSDVGVAAAYPSFLNAGIHVVTPNKKGFSSDFSLWKEIFDAKPGLAYHESSVGAGLPVISTLKELVKTGDEVTKIEGIFSGTMSFLFNNFDPVEGEGKSWSETVKVAKDLGYTEPDPRDDLNGLDVARKLTILARLGGLDIENTSAFPVQSLIPKELDNVASAAEFMQELPKYDDQMVKVKETAQKAGKVIRFVGSIDFTTQKVKVGLEEFEKSHPIAALKGSDNIISFYTKRYSSSPLIVQGAG
jgi:homoserine dehydrogenase